MARPAGKRAVIERSVVEVIAKKGLAATTVQDIAFASQVSPGLLYRYWENREALAAEVYRQHYEELARRLAAKAAEGNAWQRLRAVITEFLAFSDEQPTVVKFLLLSQHELVNTLPGEHHIRTLCAALLEAGMREGIVRVMNPELAFQFLLGIVIQPVVGVAYGTLRGPTAQYRAEILESVRRALGR